MKYVALLRGINSGKNPMIKMDFLKNIFENMGFENVKTIIASGNVVFDSSEKSAEKISQKIEKTLSKDLGFQSNAIVISISEMQKLVEDNPFKNSTLTPDKRFYVTFFNEQKETSEFKKNSDAYGVSVVDLQPLAVCYVIDINIKKTPDVIAILDRQFGRQITTRNWNTVLRIIKAAS